jgi:micrococcal nuclease
MFLIAIKSMVYGDSVGVKRFGAKLALIITVLIFATPSLADTVLIGRVTKVIDGDSFVLKTKKKAYEIRMWGIDCPEYTQPFSSEARAIARRYLKGKNVQVEVKYLDKYNRSIGVASYGNEIINEKLVREGAAWVYKRYCRTSICKKWDDIEKMARSSKRGLWNDKDAVPPWKWRRKNR